MNSSIHFITFYAICRGCSMERQALQNLTRTGIIVALTLVLQSLRLYIPMPPEVSMFLIGTLVNACLIVAVLSIHWKAGMVVALVTPFFAFLEGMLPFIFFVVPTALGNCAYVWMGAILKKRKTVFVPLVAITKASVLYGAFYLLFSLVSFPPAVRAMILTVMSWPQLITAGCGAFLGLFLARLISRIGGSL